jgi:hypothetical protein
MSIYGTPEAIAFITGKGTDDKGRTVNDYLQFDTDKWEECHDHIQWAFPSNVKSAFNPNAPVIDFNFLKERMAEYELRQVFTSNISALTWKYLYSLGIEWHNGGEPLRLMFEHPERLAWLRHKGDHNHRRITRLFILLHHLRGHMHPLRLNRLLQAQSFIVNHFEISAAYDEKTLDFWTSAIAAGINP